jgi:hemerythrin
MPLFEWKPLYSLHIEKIDHQHQQIIGYMNGFHEAQQKNSVSEAQKRLHDLLAVTQKHFTEEEAMMAKTGYPDLVNHQESHKNLLNLVTKLSNDYFTSPNATTGDKLANFLKNWLAGHILGVDKKYGPHMNSKGIH